MAPARAGGRPLGPAQRLQRLYEEAAAVFDADLTQVLSGSRTMTAVRARQAAWWIAHRQLDIAAARIGRVSGYNHTSVLHGVRRFDDEHDVYRTELAIVAARAALGPVQQRALLMLAEGRARVSNTTSPPGTPAESRTVARATATSLERLGLAHVIEIVAVASELGKQAAEHVQLPEVYRYEHGTAACYVLDGCRCLPCRVAQSERGQQHAKKQAYGAPVGLVDAAPAYRHVRTLMRSGVGLKRIAKVSGVSHGALTKLIYGVEGRERSRRIRHETETKILAVTTDALADGAVRDGQPTRDRIDALLAAGFSRAELARLIGDNPDTAALQVGRTGQVTLATARRVEEIHLAWAARTLTPCGKHHRGAEPPPCATPGCGQPRHAGNWCRSCVRNGVAAAALPSLDTDRPAPPRASRDLDATPLVRRVLARGGIGELTRGMGSEERDRLRRAYHRAASSGRITLLAADELSVQLFGLTADLVFGAELAETG